jgi:hypothetical protein
MDTLPEWLTQKLERDQQLATLFLSCQMSLLEKQLMMKKEKRQVP